MSMTVLKNTPTHAVVAFVNSGNSSYTLDLSSLVLPSRQTEVLPVVNIKGFQFSAHGGQTITITRNGQLLWSLANTGIMKFDGFVDNRQNTSDIVVVVGNGGSIVLELIKVSGFGDTEHINAI